VRHVHLPLTPEGVLWPQPWVWLLALLPLLPLLWWFWRRPARRPVLRFSSLAVVQAAAGPRRHLWHLLPALRLAVLACLIVAAARPQSPDESSHVVVEGIAIMMVLDTSASMLDRDLSPPGQDLTRLDVVKDVFRRFVAGDGRLPGRPNDLIGMVRFAREPDSVAPLALDKRPLLDLLDRTEVAVDRFGRVLDEANATAIGDGLALAVERLRNLRPVTGSGEQLVIRGRVIILLTDGENNAGLVTPEQAGELAALYGIRVYTIVAGTGQRVGFVRHPPDDAALRRIAELTGGRHFRATAAAALDEIYAEIDRLERTRTAEQRFIAWRELAGPWVLAAFVGLAAHGLLSATVLRKIP